MFGNRVVCVFVLALKGILEFVLYYYFLLVTLFQIYYEWLMDYHCEI